MADENYIPGTVIPKPKVKLIGTDGNAFAIMGRVKEALRAAGAPRPVVDAYLERSMSGNYDNLLCTACEYVEVR